MKLHLVYDYENNYYVALLREFSQKKRNQKYETRQYLAASIII